jgi:long-subunit acyl-CoA synthetase (AMP-forming)
MVSRANRLANHFLQHRCEEGRPVAFFPENQPRYLERAWAAKIAGLDCVCVSKQVNSEDVAYIL